MTQARRIKVSNQSIPRHIQLGINYGHIVQGWNFKDYVQDAAVRKDGYETIIVDGAQRVGKSNLSLQIGGWAKHALLAFKKNQVKIEDYNKAKKHGITPSAFIEKLPIKTSEQEIWEAVLVDLVFKPGDFVTTLEAVPDDDPLDSLVWDDINAHYTNTAFKINPQEYSAIDSTFTVVGTKCRVIIANIPNVTRLAKNIKDNCTFEIFVGKNRKRMMKRIYRLPGLRSMDMNLFKVDVELPSTFDIYKIPGWAWRRYESKRIELAKEALNILKAATDMQDLEGYVTVIEATKICKEKGVNWGINTIQQMGSRGIIGSQKLNGKLCVELDSLNEALEAETMNA